MESCCKKKKIIRDFKKKICIQVKKLNLSKNGKQNTLKFNGFE